MVMSLADVGWEVITPCVYAASRHRGAQRASQTLSHCFSLSFPGTPGTNGLTGFPTTIWWQSQDQDAGHQTSGLPACSLHPVAFGMEDVPSWRRNDFLSLLSTLGHLQRCSGRNDSSLLPAPEADAVCTDYREEFEQEVTHSPEESSNESGNMY